MIYNKKMFNNWLTGIIEGDGTILTPHKKLVASTARKQYPFIRIAFHKKDFPLATKLSDKLGYGNIVEDKGAKNSILWTVNTKEGLLDLIERLNGNMRTPKIHRLYQLIDWYNDELGSASPILKKELDKSPIGSNSWLSGMSDADSNFNIIISKLKNDNYRINRQWRLEFSQKTYHGMDQGYWAAQVSAFLNTNLLTRTRIQALGINGEEKLYSSFIVVAHSEFSRNIIVNYFNNFPLFSAKYLDYKDWESCGQISNVKSKANYEKAKYIKSCMNNQRTQFKWDHLNLL